MGFEWFECGIAGWESFDTISTRDNVSSLLRQADIVVNTLPHTADTENLIDAAFFNKLPKHALFINVGRGSAVVEADLAHALATEQIAHAVLDVYRTEPLPPDHVFWHTPNLTLTSHTAAPSLANDVFGVFWDNYVRFCTQQPLLYRVDIQKGY